MVTVVANDAVLGATVDGLDLAQPLPDAAIETILTALASHGVLRFPNQDLSPAQQKAFACRFGSLEVNVANRNATGEHPEIMILSNMVDAAGKPLGLADAGQDWHTDMSYSATVALANVLFAIKVPHDDHGQPLGDTRFANMIAAYEALPTALKQRLDGATITHDFNLFWERMRARPGSNRQPLTPEQRAEKPPVSHPAVMVHPVSGAKVLYANPGYAACIDGWEKADSDAVLAFLFRHQLQDAFLYDHHWTEGDLMMWDNIATLHYAVADYGAHQHRMMQRCQVMADQVFAHPRFR